MTWTEIMSVIQDTGVSLAIIGAVIYLLVKYFSKLIDDGKGKKDPAETTTVAVTTEVHELQYDSVKCLKTLHPFSNKIDSIIDTKLPITRMGGPVRTEIFREVLTIFYKTAEEEVEALLSKDITEENFLACNYNTANAIIKDSSAKMKEEGIPEIVIEKFNAWNSKRHDYVLNTISDIESSSVFSTIVEKEYAVLNSFMDACYFTLMDAEKTLKNLNGELTGTMYRGKEVEPLH